MSLTNISLALVVWGMAIVFSGIVMLVTAMVVDFARQGGV